MSDDLESHRSVPDAAELRAGPLVAPRRVGLDAQHVYPPRDRVDLPGETRDPERMDDVAARHHDIDGRAGGKMQNACGCLAVVVRITKGPALLLGVNLDPRRRRLWQREQAFVGDQPVGHQRHEDDGRQGEPTEHDSSVRWCRRTPGWSQERERKEHHDQREEHERAGEHHPPQPGNRRSRGPGGIERRERSGAARERRNRHKVDRGAKDAMIPERKSTHPTRRRRTMAKFQDDPGTQAASPVVLEMLRLDIGSKVALVGHPLHVMMVHFPVAFVIATLGIDVFYWWSGDEFWVRVGVWSSGLAFWSALAASVVGTAELVLVRGIRLLEASWSHAVAAMTLLAITGAVWGEHLFKPELILPHGLALSALASVMVGFAGWHGGKLVFDHGVGVLLAPKI